MRRLAVDPRAPEPAALQPAVALVAAGFVVAYPTDTLYGLAVDPFNAEAVARVFQIKVRPADRAMPLIAADLAQVESALGPLPEAGRRLAERFWPEGGAEHPLRTVAVRVPAHAVARLLAALCGRPITATSANVSGAPPTADPDEVARTLDGRIPLIVDAGPAPGGLPSTIVDVSGAEPRLLRAGAIAWERVREGR